MKPTDEQSLIITTKPRGGELRKVEAFAGTGKTTTLVEFAKAYPKARMLYIAFNKSVQIEAEKKFPRNVVCKTSHSLAWPGFGSRYKNKLVSSLKIRTACQVLALEKYGDGRKVVDTLMNYIASADEHIEKKHIPEDARRSRKQKKYSPLDLVVIEETIPDMSEDIVRMAKQLWSMMCDEYNQVVGMTHDGYLKLWQLSKPTLNYDVVLLDEAQDINPATADVVLRQKSVRILIGDKHQQIYSFRGADNILAKIQSDTEFAITKSFRFGRKVGELASLILKTFKNEKRDVIGLNGEGAIGTVDHNSKYTILSRTNATLFDQAVEIYRDKRIGFIGPIQNYGFETQLLDTYYMWANQQHLIRDAYIKSFNSYLEMKEYAEEVEDPELISRMRIVEKYMDKLPQLIMEITRSAAVDHKEADVLLGTGHKAKGLEWDNVVMAEDFPNLVEPNKETGELELVMPGVDMPVDEFNLIYVTLTRAAKRLEPSSSLLEFIKFIGATHLVDGYEPPVNSQGELISSAPEEAKAVVPTPVSEPIPQASDLTEDEAFWGGKEIIL